MVTFVLVQLVAGDPRDSEARSVALVSGENRVGKKGMRGREQDDRLTAEFKLEKGKGGACGGVPGGGCWATSEFPEQMKPIECP